MRNLRVSRKPFQFSESCLDRLNTYALAAGAAGVGMLALAQPAPAEVAYTSTHDVILRHSSLPIDLNHDGKVDLYINQTSGCSSEGFCQNRLYAYMPFYRDHFNAVVGQDRFPFHAYALPARAPVGMAQPFGTGAINLYFNSRTVRSAGRCSGSWIDANNRYLGLKFLIEGELHFGWARLSTKCRLGTKIVGVLSGYAYETVANQPILAGQTENGTDGATGQSGSVQPETPYALRIDPLLYPMRPATLGMLALGAEGLPLWRKELAGKAE